MQREVQDIREVGSVFSHWLNTGLRWRNGKGSHQLGLMHECIIEPSHECYASINILWVQGFQITRRLFPSIFLSSVFYEQRSGYYRTPHRVKQTSHNHTENHRRSSTAREMTFYSLCTLQCVCMYVCDRFIGVIYPAQRASVVRNGGLSARRSLLLCSLYGLH